MALCLHLRVLIFIDFEQHSITYNFVPFSVDFCFPCFLLVIGEERFPNETLLLTEGGLQQRPDTNATRTPIYLPLALILVSVRIVFEERNGATRNNKMEVGTSLDLVIQNQKVQIS